MNKTEVKKMSKEELVEAIQNYQDKYKSLKLTHVVSPLENPAEIKMVRRTIARLKTELASKQAS